MTYLSFSIILNQTYYQDGENSIGKKIK